LFEPTALVLNILVASIGTFQFWRAGHFSWKLFWAFALFSVPAAYSAQAFCCPGDFVFIGDRPSYRWDEIAFHQMTWLRL
jgi:hypothetical protein